MVLRAAELALRPRPDELRLHRQHHGERGAAGVDPSVLVPHPGVLASQQTDHHAGENAEPDQTERKRRVREVIPEADTDNAVDDRQLESVVTGDLVGAGLPVARVSDENGDRDQLESDHDDVLLRCSL